MCERLRAEPGTFGLVTANGGFLTKHSAGIYSTTPYQMTHPQASRWTRRAPRELQRELEAESEVLEVAASPVGHGVVESCTVEYGRDGPVRAIFVGKMRDGHDVGRRFVGTSKDTPAIEVVLAGNGIGVVGTVSTKGDRTTFTPDTARTKL
eukprot:gnl/MRDRNA2_/MRDRNA2_57466_c0_seq2.p1 gnl/MRDRNA2_/MRDRNA2_57466_c0~~gnl/MRDRNA2_/MRDRNA2_57466_c0_seq2.p1  ORF type:complete len:151 (-),score=27.22 gnl/MRDRNA2_/MRDRNA2_57466_c0_seq2:30-482(-)